MVLGRAFWEAEATRDLLSAFPAIGPVLEHDIRRIAFRRFPYSYLYRIATEEIRVLAVCITVGAPAIGRAVSSVAGA